jgi:hypothetical protein
MRSRSAAACTLAAASALPEMGSRMGRGSAEVALSVLSWTVGSARTGSRAAHDAAL